MANRAVDLFVTYRFLKLLVTPFNKQEAFKFGIIDEKGKVLRKYRTLTTSAEKKSYTMLHRLVFNVKRLLQKVGLGSRTGTYAAALGLLLKEYKEVDSNLIQSQFYKYLKENKLVKFDNNISESVDEYTEHLPKGNYELVNEIYNEDSELIGKKGDKIIAEQDIAPFNTVLGCHLFWVINEKTNNKLLVSADDLENV